MLNGGVTLSSSVTKDLRENLDFLRCLSSHTSAVVGAGLGDYVPLLIHGRSSGGKSWILHWTFHVTRTRRLNISHSTRAEIQLYQTKLIDTLVFFIISRLSEVVST